MKPHAMMKFLVVLVSVVIITSELEAQQNNPLINSAEVITEGTKLHDEGKYKEAIKKYKEVSRSDTNYVWALYEMAYSAYADSQFAVCKAYCEQALKLKEERERVPELLTQYANTIDELGDKQRALAIFDSAIQIYPAYAELYLNKGVTLLAMEKYKEAEDVFKTCLLIDPYNYSTHFRLGQTALYEGKIIQSFLSFIAYQMMYPGGRYQNACLSFLTMITGNETGLQQYLSNRKEEPAPSMKLLEQIVLSKIALDKNYKPIIKLDYQITRQIQVLFEKMEYDENNDDFWMQYYIPLFKQFYDNGQFEYFINHSFSEVGLEAINNFNKKNKKEIDALISDIISYLNTIRSTRLLNYEQRKKAPGVWLYADGKLTGKGNTSEDGNKSIGNWEYYYAAGNIRSKGAYDDKGARQGTWKYYFFNGDLRATEEYKDDKLEGKVQLYYTNGNTNFTDNYTDDKENGDYADYYYAGHYKTTASYKEGKLDGIKKSYYSNGNIQVIENYKDDSLEGKYESYFKNGQLESIAYYKNGQLQGQVKGYYENGSLNYDGQYDNNERAGTWKRYHPNGQLQDIETYVNGLLEGPYEEYYDNGKLFAKYQNKKGKTFGNAEYFDTDGKLYSLLTYENDILKSGVYYDKNGKEISKSETKNKQLELTVFRPDGTKSKQVNYNNKGVQTGTQTFFYNNGEIISETDNYTDGELDGISTGYFLNKNKSSEINYVNGLKDGYYKAYYLNGNIKSEGWYKNDKAEGNWLYYDELGNLTNTINYLHDEEHGYRVDFWPNGKKELEQKNYYGWFEQISQYDTLGQLIHQCSLPAGTGKYLLKHFNGNPYAEGNMVKGEFEGTFNYYYFDGSLLSEQTFKAGELNGDFKSYSFGGKLSSEGKYINGEKTGLWNYYLSNGKINQSEEYKNGQLNGRSTYYQDDGTISAVIWYKNGVRDSAATHYDENGKLSYIINYNNDIPVSYTYFDKNGNLVAPIAIPFGTGKVKAYFSNGNLATDFAYFEGKVNGEEKNYYSNGQLLNESNLLYGETNGVYKGYFSDGKEKFEYTYSNDNVNGPYKLFNNKGILVEEGIYYNGNYHGTVKLFDDNGKLKQTLIYYYGRLLSVK